jgi:hypothetical protein
VGREGSARALARALHPSPTTRRCLGAAGDSLIPFFLWLVVGGWSEGCGKEGFEIDENEKEIGIDFDQCSL